MPSVITCSKCKKYDQITAAYDCQNCDAPTRNLGPTPQGLPHSQPCPACGKDVTATNIRCLRCAVG